jgi:cellulose synthase/poly-beta-1,6-N-acetylglucosamine synthase-like glycosyltransferase
MINQLLYNLWDIFQIMLLIYLGSTGLYLLFFATASLFKIPKRHHDTEKLQRFAVLIPCYKEDDVIIEVAKEALNQHYPKELYDVIVIADNFHQHTLEELEKLPLIIYNVNFQISTKTRAINYALRNLPDNAYDAVCILDADNIMAADFLYKINNALSKEFIAVQGHRVAKNINTSFALLDAISEEINNQLFRKGQRVIGLSSALIGSAMAFEYTFFKKLMQEVEVVGGFDKELEIRLLKDGLKIEYLPDAYVYDEKVQNVKVFSQQRRRWLSAQVHYFGRNFIPAIKALIKDGNIEYFNKAIQYLQLPRILLLGVLFFLTATSTAFRIPDYTVWWLVSFAITVLSLIISVPAKFYHVSTLKALLYLPVGFIFMFLSLLKIRGANKKFIHTKHTFNAFQIKKK